MQARAKTDGREGFTLVAVGFSVVSLLGMLGLALDLGRVYVARSEAQSFTDSAALAASLALDGSSFAAARNAMTGGTKNRWNMGTETFGSGGRSTVASEFARPLASDAAKPDPDTWSSAPATAAGYTFVRVTATASLPLYILPVVGTAASQSVTAMAVAGQVPLTNISNGLLPFSPIGHSGGFVIGQRYTLRYPEGGVTDANVCPGDRDDAAFLALASAQPAEERGFYQDTQESLVQDEMVNGVMRFPVGYPGKIKMSGATMNVAQRALNERIELDTDHTSTTYAQYQANIIDGKRAGNGLRLVGVPVNAGPGASERNVTGFAGFFLSASEETPFYPPGADSAWCAEYYGVWNRGGIGAGAGTPGQAYTSVLVQ